MPTTHADAVGGTTGLPTAGKSKPLVELTFTKDCAVDNIGSGDTIECINIPANTIVIHVATTCNTVEGASDTIDVGDGDNASLYQNDLSMNSATTTLSSGVPKIYVAAGKIKVLANAALTACKFTIHVICIDVS